MPIKVSDLFEQATEVLLLLKKDENLAYTQKEISTELKIDQSTVTRQLKKLIDEGFVLAQKNYSIKGNPFYYYVKQ